MLNLLKSYLIKMNFKLIFRILGFITIFLGIAMLTPIPFSLYYNSGDVFPLIISAGISILLGSSTFLIKKYNKDIRPKEGAAVVTLAWITFSLFGCLPYIFSGSIPSFTDAFFETMSGFTTTGATILTDIESIPKGILFWRSLTHWIGGMGIIVLSIAILPFLGIGGMQLFKAEVPGPVAEKLKPRVTETAKILWEVYLLLSAIETILLMIGGMNLFDALCHTFGTMATGGYSTQNASIAAYNNPFIHYVIIVFMIFAGTNFSLHYNLFKGNFKVYKNNHEFRYFLLLILIGTIIISFDVFINTNSGFAETIQKSLFQVVSIITTTGYITADYEQWSLSSQLILFLFMFIGGSAGSTGGGMKVMRIILLFKFAYSEIVKLIHPKAIVPIRLGNKTVDQKTMSNITGYFVLVMLIAALGTIIMSFLGLDLATSFGVVAATLNNIGPGLGSVGAIDNYAHLSHPIKWILTFFMLLGRLEVFTVALLLAPSFWKK